MNILEEIAAYKKKEVADRKSLFPVKLLEKSIYFQSTPISVRRYIKREDKIGLIAEIKRSSPSKGVINQHISVETISIGYMQAGASGLSVLTDTKYFGGSSEDLEMARKFNFCPILRKDFIVDEYQVIEAKSIGADVILLIAAILSAEEVSRFGKLAKDLGMEVLLEVHDKEELDRAANDYVDLLGVNNRNLKTFETSIDVSMDLASHIPDQFVKVTESGINSPETLVRLKKEGFEGFLIGEHFMQFGRPDKACADFIRKVKSLQNQVDK